MLLESLFDLVSRTLHACTTYVINGFLPGLAVTGIASFLLPRMRRVNASTRFALWWMVLLLVISLPVLMLPAQGVFHGGHPPASEVPEGSAPAATTLSDGDRPNQSTPRTAKQNDEEGLAIEEAPPQEASPRLPGIAITATLLGALCMATSLFLLFRLIVSLRRAIGIRRSSMATDLEVQQAVSKAARRLGITKDVEVRLSPAICHPLVTFFGDPTILLPMALPKELTPEELEVVFLHELAHIARRDFRTKPIQKILAALLFFHPAVRWIDRRLDLDCEIACDDQVIAVTGNPIRYARCLTRLVELSQTPSPIPALGLSLRRKQIFRRLDSLLRHDRIRRPGLSRRFVLLNATAGTLILILSSVLIPMVPLPYDAVVYAELDGIRKPHAKELSLPNREDRIIDWSNRINNLPITFTIKAPGGESDWYTIWTCKEEGIRAASAGEVHFGIDGRSIELAEPNSFLSFIDRRVEPVREIELTPGEDGSIREAYRIDGELRNLDEAGRLWLGDLLRVLVGVIDDGAQTRANAILKHDGVAGLFEEIPRLERCSVQQIYMTEALSSGGLSVAELSKALALISGQFTQDSAKCDLLCEASPLVVRTPELLDRLFDAIETIGDPTKRGRVLASLCRSAESSTFVLEQSMHRTPDLLPDREIEILIDTLGPLCLQNPTLWDSCRTLARKIHDRSTREKVQADLESLERSR